MIICNFDSNYEMEIKNRPIISSNKQNLKETFAVHSKYEAFYTGGYVQLSEDGQYLFCTCNSQVQVLNTNTGSVVETVKKDGDDSDITAFTVDLKGEILVIASRNGLLRQWHWKDVSLVRTWKSIHSGPIRCMTFDPSSVILATGGSDSTIKIWDLEKQYCTHNLKGATGVFTVVQFHTEDSTLQVFGAADDYKIHIWDLSTGRQISILEGHFSAVTQLSFTSDGKIMFSSGRDKVVLVWNLENHTLQKTIPVYETVESVMLIEDRLIPKLDVISKDLHIVTAGSQGILKVWNVHTGKLVHTQDNVLLTSSEESAVSVVTRAAYNSVLDVIMIVTYEHNILMYKMEDFSRHKQLIGYNDEILDVRFFGENDSHLVVATNSPIIKVFELSTFNCKLLIGHTDLVLAVDVFPSKQSYMVSASKDNTVKLWCMYPETGDISCIFTGIGHTHSVTTVSSSSLACRFLVSGSQDTTLKVWNVPEKSSLVISNPTLIVHCTQHAHGKEINFVAVAPNDKLIVSGSQDKTAKVWRSEDLALIGTVRGHRKGVWCAQFSPVDQVFATSSADGTVKIWALNNFSCVKTFEGHECSVMKVLFLSRGMQLLTGGSDGNVKLWNIKVNECTKTLDEHTDKVWGMAISKDENYLVTGSADSKIIIWKDTTEEEREKKHQEFESILERDQELSNLIQQKNWHKALALAITLGKPFKALTVMKEILTEPDGAEHLDKTVKEMRQDQIDSLLKFSSVWNTNSKHCIPAQMVVHAALTLYTPEELIKLPTTRQLVEELLPYTDRHMQRMNRLLQQSSFVNYVWRTMKLGASNIQPLPVSEESEFFHIDKEREINDSEKNDAAESDGIENSKGFINGSPIRAIKTPVRKVSVVEEDSSSDSSNKNKTNNIITTEERVSNNESPKNVRKDVDRRKTPNEKANSPVAKRITRSTTKAVQASKRLKHVQKSTSPGEPKPTVKKRQNMGNL